MLAKDYRKAQKRRRGSLGDAVKDEGRVLHHLCWADDLYAMAVPVHRLGLCSMNRDERSSQNAARKFLITNSKQLEQNKNAKFYKKNYGVSERIFVKFINKSY